MNTEPIVIECTYNAPVEKVWAALTDNALMKQWYFDIAKFNPEPGFEFSFTAGNEDKQFVHLCKVKEVVSNKKLSYSWRYEGYEGDSLVIFELFPEGNGTKVKLTHEGLETFPAVQDFAKENFVQGWTHILGIALKTFVEPQAV